MKQLPVVLFPFLLAAPALAAAADDPSTILAVGDRVRVTDPAAGRRFTAEVLQVLPAALLVRTTAQAPTRRLDLSRLERLEVSRGRHGHAGTGFLVGFVPGAAFGALVGGALACYDEGSDCNALGGALLGGLYVGAITGGAGALIGWAIQTERWRPLALPAGPTVRVQPWIAPVRGGARVGVTLRF